MDGILATQESLVHMLCKIQQSTSVITGDASNSTHNTCDKRYTASGYRQVLKKLDTRWRERGRWLQLRGIFLPPHALLSAWERALAHLSRESICFCCFLCSFTWWLLWLFFAAQSLFFWYCRYGLVFFFFLLIIYCCFDAPHWYAVSSALLLVLLSFLASG